VLLEASASGLPVVATNVGGTAEIVVAGETGMLVPPNRPARIARAIVGLIRDEKRRRALGVAGRERMRELFSPRAYAEAVAGIYEATLDGRG
jgi:glycosyltransferase involved in cell wall biosynthesis